MKKEILVPIDFSGDSVNALEHAIAAANVFEKDVRMIYVKKNKNFDVPFYFKEIDKVQGLSANDFFEVLLTKYQSKVKSTLDYKIREGKIYEEISNQAKYDDAYMIIMGTHGVSGFEEFFIGSNAFKVVNNAPCPVLTIRAGFLKKKVENIVLPIDISKHSRAKVNYVTDIAARLNAKVHVLGVRELNKQGIVKKLDTYVAQVSKYMKSKGVNHSSETLLGENITDMTINYANKVNADLIAIMTEQLENPARLWMGAYEQQMVNHSPIPVLNIHPYEAIEE